MTRPMPGPPKDWWYCTPPHGEPGLCTSDMDPAEYMPFAHLQHKRLTDAECAAEFWRAMNETNSASLNNCPECPGCQAIVDEELTWHRFAIYPHALEADGAAS